MNGFVQKKLICTGVTALVLLLSGAGCALCCFAGAASSYWLGEMSCAQATSGDDSCCKTALRNSERDHSDTISESITQCSLLAKHIEGLIAPNHSVPLIGVFSVTASHGSVASQQSPHQVKIPPSNRGSTYLRCCVLLI